MKSLSMKNFHVHLSIGLYLISLTLPACFLGQTREPLPSIDLLISGAFGILVGAFSWYANPLFLLAVSNSKKPISIAFGFLSLILALSFSLYEHVTYINMDSQKNITSFGWGYFLWVMAIAIFFAGQTLRFSELGTQSIPISITVTTLIGSYAFYAHYYKKIDSQHSIQAERNKIYDFECQDAKTTIFGYAQNVRSIYFEGFTHEYKRELSIWKEESSQFSIIGYVNSGYLEFGESKNDFRDHTNNELNMPYTRYRNQKTIYVEEIISDAEIIVRSINYPKKINLTVKEITIADRRTRKILTKSKFVYDKYNKRLCGEIDRHEFSLADLAKKTLNLEKKHNSL